MSANSGSQNKAVVNKLLTDVSNAYTPQGLIAEMIFPKLQVAQDSGIIGAYGKDHLRIENTMRSGRARARMATPIVRLTDTTYQLQNHELMGEVTEEDYKNVEQPFDAEKDETMGLTSLLKLEKEWVVAQVLQNASVLTNNVTLSGTDKWSDYANSNPIGVFKTQQNTIVNACGVPANKAIVPLFVFNTLKYHPQILANLGYAANRAGKLTPQELAEVMGVKEILIPEAAYNSGVEGQTDVMAQVWGNDVTFLVAPPAPGKYQTTLGYEIGRKGQAPMRVKKWNIDETFGHTGLLVGDTYQYKLVDVAAAYLVKGAI